MTVNGMTGSNDCFSDSSDKSSRGEKRRTDAVNESIVIDMVDKLPEACRHVPRTGRPVICDYFLRAKQFAPLALVLSSQIGRVKNSRFFVPGFSPDSNSDSAASTRSCPCSVAL